jgi:hypothetical protein
LQLKYKTINNTDNAKHEAEVVKIIFIIFKNVTIQILHILTVLQTKT